MKNPKLILLDCCQPDYFRGHTNAVLSAMVDCETLVEEVVNQVLEEACGMVLEAEFSGYNYNDLNLAIEGFRKDNAEVQGKPCFPSLEKYTEGGEVHAYFTVIDEE